MNWEQTKRRICDIVGFFRPVILLILLAIVVRVFLCQLYVIPSRSMVPALNVGDALVVNKISYGLYMPFLQKRIIEWSQPKRGDMVVFQRRTNGVDYIKRLVAVAGDTVKIVAHVVHINGVATTQAAMARHATCREPKDAPTLPPLGSECACIRRLEAPFTNNETSAGSPHAVQHMSRECVSTMPNWPPGLRQGWETQPRRDGAIIVPQGHVFLLGDNRGGSVDSRSWGSLPTDRIKGVALYRWYSPVKETAWMFL